MPFGKSPEEKQAEAAARAAEQTAAAAAAKRKAFFASPLGQAVLAKQANEGFFEVQLEVGTSQRDVTFGTRDYSAGTDTKQHGGLLSQIEFLGWHLEHVGYFFMVTGESSRSKILGTGEYTAVSGVTVGTYLFRNSGAALPAEYAAWLQPSDIKA